MAKQEPVLNEEADVAAAPAPRWPKFRLWAITLAAAIAAASGTLLLPPAISPAAPFWAPYLLDILRFLVLWYIAGVIVRSLFFLTEWLLEALLPPRQFSSSSD
ncbi:hypothetical protein [Acidithiobacillus sp. AMEEHan]|uniref:hypothetical protein n=1 Tax=Acidithiobacillus sp. AMEEHan TaxID=2994951 RepID=UPI0027E458E6|nr:hypothetical protein [Acidithiobacillus sp. AMEEHan]